MYIGNSVQNSIILLKGFHSSNRFTSRVSKIRNEVVLDVNTIKNTELTWLEIEGNCNELFSSLQKVKM